ncbi:MAG: Nif3-like dinuclear metal center hexameric protein [Sedimentisphaerales bacterium]|nr:Nif3-like dinuclear metal center hexameric protein [Sedimentisphaerales bacterium]
MSKRINAIELRDVMTALDQIAPTSLAADWDNVGLLAGDPAQPVRRMLLTIDLTQAVFEEALKQQTDLIVAYHPPIFTGLKRIVPGPTPSGLIYHAIRHNIAVYALHTSLDVIPGGANDALAEIIGIIDPQPLQPADIGDAPACKVVVYVPISDVEDVSEAMWAAGAGVIGDNAKYKRCSFRTPGTGTFQGGDDSNPTIGQPGRFETVDEIRLETVAPISKLAAVIKAMLAAHSYEEPAYDIFSMKAVNPGVGQGRFGDLEKPVPVQKLIETIKVKLKLSTVGVIGPMRRSVHRAAVGAGSCGTMFRDVIREKCDFYLTGELKHHFALELQEAGVTTVCVGHSNSERFMCARLAHRLRTLCPTLTVAISKRDCDPFQWR